MNKNQIGITIITGFLGSGKTSLLNQILKKERNFKFAIIENEFSELGIDAELISGIESQNIVELSNGCICCTRNTELQETLEELLVSGLKFDHLLIETTGIAEPDSIVQSIVANIELKEIFYIDSVICLVDAGNYFEDIEKTEAIKQVAMADLVIVNKVEKKTKEFTEEIEKSVFQINPLCNTIKTSHSDYTDHQLISSKIFNHKNFENAFNHLNQKLSFDIEQSDLIQSIGIKLDGDFISNKFMYWMEYFLLLNQNNIYRAKGIISFNGNSRKIVFQAVKASFTIEEGDFWPSGIVRQNRIIFIGKGLNKLEIHKSLKLLMHD